jgi:hypothetical protein
LVWKSRGIGHTAFCLLSMERVWAVVDRRASALERGSLAHRNWSSVRILLQTNRAMDPLKRSGEEVLMRNLCILGSSDGCGAFLEARLLGLELGSWESWGADSDLGMDVLEAGSVGEVGRARLGPEKCAVYGRDGASRHVSIGLMRSVNRGWGVWGVRKLGIVRQ